MAPNLPARVAGGRRVAGANRQGNQLPILQAQEIELEDGTKIPIKIPPGMPPAQAQALIEYLKSNPEAAKQCQAQAKQMLKNPGMAQAFLSMQNPAINPANNPEMADKYAALKDDPELKPIFDDVLANGPEAFSKYWDDSDLMTKIADKMKSMGITPPAAADAPKPAGKPAGPLTSLHDAAKWGDLEAITRLLEEGKAVDEANERGIAPLGVAVGFNRLEAVKLLLEKGAQVDQRDGQGNTVLFYAAGYGRREIAKVLLAAGADPEATNKQGQKPADVATLNKEKTMIDFFKNLKKGEGKEEEEEAKSS